MLVIIFVIIFGAVIVGLALNWPCFSGKSAELLGLPGAVPGGEPHDESLPHE